MGLLRHKLVQVRRRQRGWSSSDERLLQVSPRALDNRDALKSRVPLRNEASTLHEPTAWNPRR